MTKNNTIGAFHTTVPYANGTERAIIQWANIVVPANIMAASTNQPLTRHGNIFNCPPIERSKFLIPSPLFPDS
jgi:hypothetical protein